MPGGAVLAIAAAVLAAAADTKAARADGEAPPGGGLALDVVGACPDAGEVRRLLTGLVSPVEAPAAPISVQDRGPNFRIAVGESAVMLADPARDCAARNLDCLSGPRCPQGRVRRRGARDRVRQRKRLLRGCGSLTRQ